MSNGLDWKHVISIQLDGSTAMKGGRQDRRGNSDGPYTASFKSVKKAVIKAEQQQTQQVWGQQDELLGEYKTQI